ncbi:MAG: ComEC/Rec2 family competence protein [Thermoanaerobaculia bacterium]
MTVPQGYLSVDFLDVGQGDGTLIVFPDDSPVLVDMGSKKNANVAGKDALAYVHDKLLDIQARRGTMHPTLDILFLTHGDADHYNLIVPLIESFGDEEPLTVEAVYIGGPMADYAGPIQAWLQRWDQLERLTVFGNCEHDPIDSPAWPFDDPFHEMQQAFIYLLSVNVPNIGGPKNAKSICLMVEYAGRKVILMGDAEETTEDYIIGWYQAASPSFLHCDALKLGHHGSEAADKNPWLQATQAWCVFASSDQKWAHPYCSVIQRVIDNGKLDRDGAHYWLCGQGANASKEYFFWAGNDANRTYDIYTNLAYMKHLSGSSPEEQQLIEQINNDVDVDGVLPNGIVLGVQYSFRVHHDGSVEVLVTDLLDGVTEVVATQPAGQP